MNVIVSFSGRKDGNCDRIAEFISKQEDCIFYMRDLSMQPCANCNYECFSDNCKYQGDGLNMFFNMISKADKIFYIIPMYCGNPSALYFIMNERSQAYFMQNGKSYDDFIRKLFVIGVYGNRMDYPDFEQTFARNYAFSEPEKHILGLERHQYGHKMQDYLLNEDEVKEKLKVFCNIEVEKI